MVKKQFRFYFFLIQGYFKRHFLFIAIGLTAISAFLFFLKTNRLQQPILRIGLVGQYEKTNLPRNISNLIGRELLRLMKGEKSYPLSPKAGKSAKIKKLILLRLKKILFGMTAK